MEKVFLDIEKEWYDEMSERDFIKKYQGEMGMTDDMNLKTCIEK